MSLKILVATEDLTFSVSLSHAYKALGHEVSAGLPELYLGLRDFDLIHFHWPEELTGWAMPPSTRAVRRVLDRIDALKPQTKMVCTVHNLLPHADRGGESEALYTAFYARMDVIGHFSESSRIFSRIFGFGVKTVPVKYILLHRYPPVWCAMSCHFFLSVNFKSA